jgi:hypothetical protein
MNISGNISESLIKNFCGLQILIFDLDLDPGFGIRHEKLGSGIFIPDPQNTDW